MGMTIYIVNEDREAEVKRWAESQIWKYAMILKFNKVIQIVNFLKCIAEDIGKWVSVK